MRELVLLSCSKNDCSALMYGPLLGREHQRHSVKTFPWPPHGFLPGDENGEKANRAAHQNGRHGDRGSLQRPAADLADALIKPQPCEDRRPLCLENSKVPCTPTLAGPPETRAAWPLAFPFVLEEAPQVHPLPTPLPLCPSHFRAWRFWAKQGSRAIPTMSFSCCCPCFTVPSRGRLHAAGKPSLRQHVPHKVNELAWARGTVFGGARKRRVLNRLS